MAAPFNIFGFGAKPETYLGVDIGTLSIKVVELSNKNGRPKLENYGILQNYALAAASSVQDSNVQKTQKAFGGEAALMLRRILKEAGITAQEANISVPIFSSFLTVMELPSMPEPEIINAVQFEAKKYIPVPIDSVIIDWSLIGTNSEGKILILLVAIPKELINEYLEIGRDAGLRPSAVELETVSAARALIGNDPIPMVLIDMGSRDTTISVVDGGYLRISHSIETSGEDLTRVLANNLSINWRRAEELKKQVGLKIMDNNTQIASVIIPVLDVISGAISGIIDLYFSKTKKKIEKLIVYGGAAKMPGFVDYLRNKLKLETASGDPFSRIVYPDSLKSMIKETGHELTIAVGLALRAMQ